MKLGITTTNKTSALVLGLAALTITTLQRITPASAILVPGADTPLFYLVATDPFSENDNFLPLRISGGRNQSTLTGDGPIGQFYFMNGKLVAQDPAGGPTSPYVYSPYVDLSDKLGRNENGVYDPTLSDPNDHCISTSGPLIFVQRTRPDGSTFHPPKCANFDTFSLFSDRMGPILGAKLVMNSNWTNLYSCGKERNVSFNQFWFHRS
ncbi:hypothetical protein CC2G_013566 [Coprinopsis cinerea AmutBmut pab1-1]|nr:hypothetical protein CC2G_013566 [Coprinopsis cinerea AmutBmut pab1-1]